MKNLLIPTDFSGVAHNAVDYSVHLFEGEIINCTLLNSFIEPPLTDDVLISIQDILEKQSREDLKRELDEMIKAHPDGHIRWNTSSRYGFLPESIKKQLRENKIDLLVMGTKGATGMQKVFGGSHTSEVLKSIHCPMLVIPENAHFDKINRIAFAADYQKIKNEEALKPMRELILKHNAELFIVNINPEINDLDFDHKKEEVHLDSLLEAVSHHFISMHHPDFIEGMEKFTVENDIDLVVFLAREHDLFDRLIHGSTTRKFVLKAPLPMLILPDRF